MYLFTQLTPEVISATKLMVLIPPQLSVALTELVAGVGTLNEQTTVTGAGHVTDGGTLSNTVMI